MAEDEPQNYSFAEYIYLRSWMEQTNRKSVIMYDITERVYDSLYDGVIKRSEYNELLDIAQRRVNNREVKIDC